MEVDRGQAGAWMDKALAGDDGAFEQFARAVRQPLYRFALAHGLPRCEAGDAVQETLLRAYRGRKSWRAGGDAVAWVYGVAMNVVREHRRKAGRRARLGIDPDIVAAATPDGPAIAERRRDLERLRRAIASLPDRQREAVACRFLRRMSVSETAAAMGCAEGTVKAATFAAMKNLRDAMRADRA